MTGVPTWVEPDGVTGTVLPVLRAPHPALRTPATEVDPRDPEIVQLAADLMVTMRASPGCVGLAAPQIGVAAAVFALDVSGHPRAARVHGAVVLCNARIVEASRWQKGREGCLSIPDLTGDVKRAGRVVLVGQVAGSRETVTMTTTGFEARAVQHEIDHCAGRLFPERVAGAHAIFARKVYL